MMKSQPSLNNILLSNTWQENFNTWTFHESVILIKRYSKPTITRLVEYSIDEIEDKVILKTKNEDFGDLQIQIQHETPLPKILLKSTRNLNRQFVLEAFAGFSKEQKFIIESQVNRLKEIFYLKQREVDERIFDIMSRSSDSAKSLGDYGVSLAQIARKVSMLETIVNTTVDIASNFERYYENISNDVNNLVDEINKI